MLVPDGPVLGQAASGLAHEPHRCVIGGLTAGGLKERRVGDGAQLLLFPSGKGILFGCDPVHGADVQTERASSISGHGEIVAGGERLAGSSQARRQLVQRPCAHGAYPRTGGDPRIDAKPGRGRRLPIQRTVSAPGAEARIRSG